MKFKEANKQKFYMRNVYINQIMKPQIQNNLNYAYFENPRNIAGYCNNQGQDLNDKNIFFNHRPLKTFYQNYIPKENKSEKDTFSYRKSDIENDEIFYEKNLEELCKSKTYGRKHKKNENYFNERSFSEGKMKSSIQFYTVLKKNERKHENISYLKVNQLNKNGKNMKYMNKQSDNNIKFYDLGSKESIFKNTNNENISSRNTNSSSSKNAFINSKKCIYNDRNKKQNIKEGKNTYLSEYNKNTINQFKNLIKMNNVCTTSTNSNNNSYNYTINKNTNLKYSNKTLSGKVRIKSYNYLGQNQNQCFKSVEKNPNRNTINYKNYINNYNTPNKMPDEYKNMENISTLNSPSVPSYSSIIDDISINSKNYVWIKKNIKKSKLYSNNIDNNYLYNYEKNPNINKSNFINQNIINFASDTTNLNTSLYNTEIAYPDSLTKEIKIYEMKDLFEHSAILIQSAFRGYLVKKKFDTFYCNYKHYYNKGVELLELILNYFFKKSINIIEEKQKFFKYLLSLRRVKTLANKNRNKNKMNQKPKTNKNNYLIKSHYSSNNFKYNTKTKKYYQDLFLHKEIGERFNIIKENNKENDIEKMYKDKLDGINIKLNKLMKENNILKEINQKNIIKESKYREMSKDNKKKDDIINIITNDNKTLARKLKIIQDKYNKLQIQNQDYINYNSDNEQSNKNCGIDLFEEYRNLFLEFLIYKMHEKYYLSTLRNYFYKFKDNCLSEELNGKSREILKEQKLKYLVNNKNNKNIINLYHNLSKFYYKGKLCQKEIENKNNKLKYKLLNIFKNKENSYKSNLKTYFYKFYYKGIIFNIKQQKSNKKIYISKENYGKIKQFLNVLLKRKDKYNKDLKREYFIKWHLYTKVLGLKALINDKRRKKRQKQKLKKKNENEATNKYLTNNKILHFGKSNIYILNKDKEKELLISLDEKNQTYLTSNENMNLDNKYNNVIQATKKLGEIFYKAAHKHQLLDNKIDIKQKSENEIKDDKIKDNIDNNNIEEEEDSGDSFGI